MVGDMSLGILVAVILVFRLACGPAAAADRSFAEVFDVPDGFVVDAAPAGAAAPPAEEAGRIVLTIRPAPGPFAAFSEMRLRVIEGAIDDPDAWLRRRMQIDAIRGEGLGQLFDSPDSPFADPAFDGLRKAIPDVAAGLDRLSELPLDACVGPERSRSDDGAVRHQLRCEHGIGPLHRYAAIRLQAGDGVWYAIDMVAVNEQRFRHFLAIANSFDPDRVP